MALISLLIDSYIFGILSDIRAELLSTGVILWNL